MPLTGFDGARPAIEFVGDVLEPIQIELDLEVSGRDAAQGQVEGPVGLERDFVVPGFDSQMNEVAALVGLQFVMIAEALILPVKVDVTPGTGCPSLARTSPRTWPNCAHPGCPRKQIVAVSNSQRVANFTLASVFSLVRLRISLWSTTNSSVPDCIFFRKRNPICTVIPEPVRKCPSEYFNGSLRPTGSWTPTQNPPTPTPFL